MRHTPFGETIRIVAGATNESDDAGLGLAIAKALVEAHDGQIWAQNAPTGGACFHFTLPRA